MLAAAFTSLVELNCSELIARNQTCIRLRFPTQSISKSRLTLHIANLRDFTIIGKARVVSAAASGLYRISTFTLHLKVRYVVSSASYPETSDPATPRSRFGADNGLESHGWVCTMYCIQIRYATILSGVAVDRSRRRLYNIFTRSV